MLHRLRIAAHEHVAAQLGIGCSFSALDGVAHHVQLGEAEGELSRYFLGRRLFRRWDCWGLGSSRRDFR
jgi:hypothetical protein